MPGLLSSLFACIGLYTIEQPPPSSSQVTRKISASRLEPPKPTVPSTPPAALSPPPAGPAMDTRTMRERHPARRPQPVRESHPARNTQSAPIPSDGSQNLRTPRDRPAPKQNACGLYGHPRGRPHVNHDPYYWSDDESTRAYANHAPNDSCPPSGCPAPHGDDESPGQWRTPNQHSAFAYPEPIPYTALPSGHGVPQATPQSIDPHPANDSHTNRDSGRHHSVRHRPQSSHLTLDKTAIAQVRLVAPPPPPALASSGPEPLRRSKKKRCSASAVGYIWPKDPRPGNPGRWSRGSRFKDVLTGKGPDMYVGRIGGRPRDEVTVKAKRAQKENERYRWDSEKHWSLWGYEHEIQCTAEYCDDCDKLEEQKIRDNILTSARRRSAKRYDYRMRKYRVPDEGTWSGVTFCREECHVVPREYRDHRGNWYPANKWHDIVHGPHTD
ncbi:hypothetical protein BJX63DRAFT_301448 [Aspergillus granulosus]|uniref:Uncharacterized protein n=1 Tax=Aspergillus granulosus TaxID=176169 RepID=A0ABR4H658_9EURO